MQLHAMCIFAIGLFAMFKYITSNKSFINKNNDCVKHLFYEQIYALNLISFFYSNHHNKNQEKRSKLNLRHSG